MAVLGYLPKLKRGLRPASGTHFLHDFLIKIFLIEYSINGHNFQCHNFFPSQDTRQNVLLSSYLSS